MRFLEIISSGFFDLVAIALIALISIVAMFFMVTLAFGPALLAVETGNVSFYWLYLVSVFLFSLILGWMD